MYDATHGPRLPPAARPLAKPVDIGSPDTKIAAEGTSPLQLSPLERLEGEINHLVPKLGTPMPAETLACSLLDCVSGDKLELDQLTPWIVQNILPLMPPGAWKALDEQALEKNGAHLATVFFPSSLKVNPNYGYEALAAGLNQLPGLTHLRIPAPEDRVPLDLGGLDPRPSLLIEVWGNVPHQNVRILAPLDATVKGKGTVSGAVIFIKEADGRIAAGSAHTLDCETGDALPDRISELRSALDRLNKATNVQDYAVGFIDTVHAYLLRQGPRENSGATLQGGGAFLATALSEIHTAMTRSRFDMSSLSFDKLDQMARCLDGLPIENDGRYRLVADIAFTHLPLKLEENVQANKKLFEDMSSGESFAQAANDVWLPRSLAGKCAVVLNKDKSAAGQGKFNSVYPMTAKLPDGSSFVGLYKSNDNVAQALNDPWLQAAQVHEMLPRWSIRNHATSQLDQLLKLDVIARTHLVLDTKRVRGENKGELGCIMATAPGIPAAECLVRMNISVDPSIAQLLRTQPELLTRLAASTGIPLEVSGKNALATTRESSIAIPDLTHPELRCKLTDLQWLDFITGQTDRHEGNYFISMERGRVKVTGIDNDRSFPVLNDPARAPEMAGEVANEMADLPKVISRETADSILALDRRSVEACCQGLFRAEIDAVWNRVVTAQEKIRSFESGAQDRSGKIVDQMVDWSSQEVTSLLGVPDATGAQRLLDDKPVPSYIARLSAAQLLGHGIIRGKLASMMKPG
jgi:hypothetical protein